MDSIPSMGGEMPATEAALRVFIAIIPYWIAAVAGLLIGWSWRPQWVAALVFLATRGKFRLVWTVPPGLGARRLWLALTALSVFSVLKRIFRRFKAPSKPSRDEIAIAGSASSRGEADRGSLSVSDEEDEPPELTDTDLRFLISYVEERDGGPQWQLIMENSTNTLTYQAWRRDTETGSMQLRTRTIFENTSPELVRDFFWDDEFRMTWDDMLIFSEILEKCPQTGTMIVHWIRKFPFFCRDREYIIIRRIWEYRSSYYCITKGTQYPSLPRRRSPRRVDLYYSNWCVKAVESRDGRGLTSSEVLFFHYEDMGIPKELAKIGILKVMWGLVKKVDAAMEEYKKLRTNGAPSRFAVMAGVTTKIPSTEMLSLPASESDGTERVLHQEAGTCASQKSGGRKRVVKWLIVGGVLILCGGVIGKGVALGFCKSLQKGREKKNEQERRLYCTEKYR
ncbi:hypothetical protein H6P81_013527 [Aristolochia fimbriata]|uniref:START domain-containing protein n=1 Tax=Aristolochia fimbriata TaxID=158543 RepID=A0AAV7EGL1_ARIFI|nr:hypothetical protein H6P81_013527 [Aristolochia fimbriata]